MAGSICGGCEGPLKPSGLNLLSRLWGEAGSSRAGGRGFLNRKGSAASAIRNSAEEIAWNLLETAKRSD